MLDIIIIICCISGGFALGKFVERRLGDKGRFYKDLTRYVLSLKENVGGRQLELAKFNEEFAQSCSKPFADYLLLGRLNVSLTKAQREDLRLFFDNLDCVSSQALLRHLECQGKILTAECDEVLSKETSKASVYGKLGMLLGAMLGILLV